MVLRDVLESAEHASRVDAVGFHVRRPIAIGAVDEARIDAHLTRKLTAITGNPLVDERLVPVGVDDLVARRVRRRRRPEAGLEHAIEIVVVEVGEADRIAAGARQVSGLRQIRDASPVRPDDILLVGRQDVRAAESRSHLPAVLDVHVVDAVADHDLVEPDAGIHRESRASRDADVTVVES